ncbi:MAG: hypothetical protein SangKO_091380 [Sandaracinaceae bacterium]
MACAGAGVVPAQTTTPTVSRVLPGTLVAGRLGRPPRVTARSVGMPQIALLAVQSGDARLDRAERHLVRLLGEGGAADSVLMEADLGPSGAPQPAFLVTFRVLNAQSTFHGPDGRWYLGLVLGSLTAGLGWLAAIESHMNFTHSFEFEVRVHDVRGAPMVRATDDDGTIINRYDTSVAAPLMRRIYENEMYTWIGSGTSGPSGAALRAHLDEQGAVLAQIMYDMSIEDVLGAIRRGLAQAPPTTMANPQPSADTAPDEGAPPDYHFEQ